jgi:uncharacterized membrane protein
MRRVQCAIHFPVCEIGNSFNRVCQHSCKEAVKHKCPQLEGFCNTFSIEEMEPSKAKCFKLEYAGPAVGMWVAGFTISLVFSILNSIGINLQKLSLNRNEQAEEKKTTFKQPLWVLGFGLVVLGSLLDFIAFGMAPQSLLAPLAALSLVWNMFIAPIFHKEKVTRQNMVATVIIFAGVTLTVIFAGHSTPEYELKDLLKLYRQPAMYAYVFFVFAFLLGLFLSMRHIEKTHQHEGGLYHIICYGGIAGTFGGQSVLLAKSTVELLKSAIWGEGTYAFKYFATYMITFGLFGCLFFQVKFLNGGLARFDALVMVPVYQSFWILMSVLGGIIYFEEYISMTSSQKFMFTLGGLITIFGIIYLLRTRQDTESGGESGRYVELSITPSNAWNADDSDEEEIQLKLDNRIQLDDEDEILSSKANTTSTKTSSTLFKGTNNKKVIDSNNVSNAIYRTSNLPQGSSPTKGNNKNQNHDDDDFI